VLNTLSITAPIYFLIASGYLAGRLGMFSKDDMRMLGKFVLNFALPALLFRTLSQRSMAEMLNGWYLVAYGVGSLIVFFPALILAHYGRKKPMSFSVFFGMGMSFSNSAFIGFPIVLQWLGPPATVALALDLIAESIVFLPLMLGLAECGRDQTEGRQRVIITSLRNLVINPLILAIFAGFGFSLIGIPLPEPIFRTIDLLSMASAPLALFFVGGSLVGLAIRGMLRDIVEVALGKLVAHPLSVALILFLLPPIDPTLRAAAVAYASVPMLSIYPILAEKYQQEGFCAAALLVTTALSFVTINLSLWVMSAVLTFY
jgi:malonate transporter and related proteins